MNELFQSIRLASIELNLLKEDVRKEVLKTIAQEAINQSEAILQANQLDLNAMDAKNPKFDRLRLSKEIIKDIARDINNVAEAETPLGKILMESTLPNGVRLKKITLAFGVIGVIYEARPNVSFDVFSLCFKSGNACILKGGTDATHSNQAIVGLIQKVLLKFNVSPLVCSLLPNGKEASIKLLNARKYVDLIIPRGGKSLINFVRENSKVPVIETGAGICHCYFDEFGDVKKGISIVNNAKTRRVGVCNALDCLIIHEKRLCELPSLCKMLEKNEVEIYADSQAYQYLAGSYPSKWLFKADDESYGTEFLDYKMSIKTVANIKHAIEHISKYSSMHSECIISEDHEAIAYFETMVDAACVYSNVSTAFTDGAQFGLGAEIGISTQKLHARGPMALQELCTYKWIIRGEGQIRK
ncbi:gamma-glutamyl-phosphate reductase [Bacteroidales bacterium]|nr:gamma-glutamyl-phosphate reductase [Bacteroidales bacterium]